MVDARGDTVGSAASVGSKAGKKRRVLRACVRRKQTVRVSVERDITTVEGGQCVAPTDDGIATIVIFIEQPVSLTDICELTDVLLLA